MEQTTRDTLVAALAGGGVAVGLYWLGGHVGLALVTGVCWGCGLKLTFHVDRLYPAFATGATWGDRRWAGVGIGVVALAALAGVTPTLPVSNEVRLGLGLLVTGAGLTAYAAGTMAVLERVVDGSTTGSTADPPYLADTE
jgi:hypothetical protein